LDTAPLVPYIVGAVSLSLPMGNENAVARSLPLLREAEYALLVAF
jgi:hypothetical protein